MGACLPLVGRRIPMNAIYGVRIPKSFEGNDQWYDINEVGGMIMSMVSFPLFLAGILGFFLPDSAVGMFGLVTSLVLFASIGLAVAYIVRYASKK
jgi:hypothetical protein